ncbi:MAG: hypothetical protein ROO71_08875 [Balneola sp.]
MNKVRLRIDRNQLKDMLKDLDSGKIDDVKTSIKNWIRDINNELDEIEKK